MANQFHVQDKISTDNFASLYNGLDVLTPVLDGSLRRYINFDNAASTPPLAAVEQAVDNFMTYYSSVHRGTGFKSQLATHIYEEARQIVLDFLAWLCLTNNINRPVENEIFC